MHSTNPNLIGKKIEKYLSKKYAKNKTDDAPFYFLVYVFLCFLGYRYINKQIQKNKIDS